MILGVVGKFDWVGAWEESSIFLTGAFGIIGLATEFRNKHSKKITPWGWVSLLGIVISSVGGIAAQRQKDREDLENLNRTIATFENTAETVKNTAETVKSINRYAATLQGATVRVGYDLDCVFYPSPCGKSSELERALKSDHLSIKLFASAQDAEKYINQGYGTADLEWELSLPDSDNEPIYEADVLHTLTAKINGFRPSTDDVPTGKILSLLDLPNTTAIVKGYSESLGIPIEDIQVFIPDGRRIKSNRCQTVMIHNSPMPAIAADRCIFPN